MTVRLLLTGDRDAPRQDLEAYREAGGYEGLARALRDLSPEEVIDEIERARLRGRGGAAFPVARKWRLARAAAESERYVIANGGEHEPGSAKDAFLMARYPHAVLEGLLLCGYATGARRGWVYVIEDAQDALESMEAAVAEARAAGLSGEGVLGGHFAFQVEVVRAPSTYVAGEETAALDAIENGPGKPRAKPPYPGEAGLFRKPTTVNNVETLAHAAVVARIGGARYAEIGTAESTGTMLFTLSDQVHRPGVHELPFGATYRELLEEHGGGLRSGRAVRAILPAMSCAFLGAEHLDTPIAHETLRAAGSSPGCGGVRLVEEGEDVVELLLEIARFFAGAQCGQCPPCRMETSQFVHLLEQARAGREPAVLAKAEKLAAFTRGKGRCSLIEMAAAPVLSGVRLFAEDLARAAGD